MAITPTTPSQPKRPLRPIILGIYLLGSMLFLIAAILYLKMTDHKIADIIYVFCALCFVIASSLDIYDYNQLRTG